MADELSKTVFKDPDCFINSNIWEIESKLREEGPSWVWRDGKGGFEAYTPHCRQPRSRRRMSGSARARTTRQSLSEGKERAIGRYWARHVV